MWIPDETINAIRQEANIVDIVSNYVQVKKQGNNYFASCPFHEERTPSFSVQEEKQFYHCFSCGRGGNVFNFIQEIEGLDFPEAVIKVAEMIDYPLDSSLIQGYNGSGEKKSEPHQDLLDLYEEAGRFYQQVLLQTEAGQPAFNYLTDRGLEDETIELFQLGYSPSQKEALFEYLTGKLGKLSPDLLRQSALFVESESGEFLDRFNQRVVFPIKNNKSQIIAFSGRFVNFSNDPYFEDERPQAKYINSSDTPIFNKSDTLFNINLARSTIRRDNEVFLFEGYMDVIASYQAGLENGLASMGTSLTQSQIHQLKRLTSKVVIAYDGDEAGQHASDRAIDLLRDSGMDVELILFPKGSDPDDYIRQQGSEAYLDLMHHGRLTTVGFYQQYYRQDKNLNNEADLIEYVEQVLSKMLDVPSALEREVYMKQLAEEFDFSLESLQQQFQELLDHRRHQQLQEDYKHRQVDRASSQEEIEGRLLEGESYERAENIILHRLFHYPDDVYRLLDANDQFAFVSEEASLLALVFQEFRSKNEDLSTSHFMDFLKEKELKERLAQVEMMTLSPDFNEDEVLECIAYLQKNNLYRQLKQVQDAMNKAAKLGNVEDQEKYLKEIIELSRRIEDEN